MNCLFSGAIARIGGAQKRAGGVASAKYSITTNPAENIKINAINIIIFSLMKSESASSV